MERDSVSRSGGEGRGSARKSPHEYVSPDEAGIRGSFLLPSLPFVDGGAAAGMLARDQIAHDLSEIKRVLSECPDLGPKELGPSRVQLDAVLSDLRLWASLAHSREAATRVRSSKLRARSNDYTRRKR